ncbi:hypothetical protein CY34DRAFT_106246 [Suillus luteus UH-Slu-Lm8-n1]|uniref:Uncharacterized protein n=1 Tax=Suillus luteus UH-Slu-Lm8-n1 TaxID=930992 RepID=A0A0D0BCA0_9AGAM|nr:hypothetical protein CY34DRAFT_106246 [Suillus luteus UH-Slu-Lm8-n1]
MDTSNSAKKTVRSMLQALTHSDRSYRSMSPSTDTEARYKKGKNGIKRLKVEERDAEPQAIRPKREEPNDEEPMFLLPPFRQTPGPISVSQSYIRRLILEHWNAEIRYCEKAKKLGQLEIGPAPGLRLTIIQASLQRLVADRWDAEVKRCEEAKRAQLLELLLAAHGITRLV